MRRFGKVRRTTLIALGLSSFLAGLCIARFFEAGNVLILLVIFGIGVVLKKSSILQVASVIVLGLLLGNWRGTVFMHRLQSYDDYSKRLVTVNATAVSDAVYGDKGQLVLDVGSVQMISPRTDWLVGKISVKGYGESMVYRGDRIRVTAKLYPTRGSRQASMGFAKIVRIQTGSSPVDNLRRRFSAGLQSVMPEPLGSLGLGILIGQRTTLPEHVNEQLSQVGLTHIVAVSGYNLTIIVLAVHHMLRKRSKYQSTVITLLFIGLFLTVVGGSASIIRAVIVSVLSLWAWYFGRTFRPIVLILLTAVATAGWFPPYIWGDIGWYLSFLAFAGVLIVAPVITQRFKGSKEPKLLAVVLIETISAQIMTLPIILFIFGRLSLVAIVSNMLIVPLVPLAMTLSFIAGVSAMVLPTLAGWIAWPAILLLTYVLDVVQVLADLPHASIAQKFNVYQLAIAYALVLVIVLIWWHKVSPDVKIKKLTSRNIGAKLVQ